MNHVTALLAFAAIMLVLTTLATVIVEGVHKFFNQRAADFDGMLTQLYEGTIKPRIKEEFKNFQEGSCKTESLSSSDFIDALVTNPAFAKPNKRRHRIPFVRNLFSTAFDQLTTRQFCEQLSRTRIADDLAKLGDEKARSIITNLSYEFERYGEAASMYFKRRAAVLSVVVAFILAFSINIDAVRLYSALAQDNDLANQVVANIDAARLEAAYARENEGKTPDEILQEVRSEARRLEELGLPIGHTFFPFCANAESLGELTPAEVDPRCKSVAYKEYKSDLPWIGGFVGTVKSVIGNAYTRLTTATGFSWIISVLVTGGLIGLGAPFWFKTYQFIVDYVPGAKLPDRTLARQTRSGKSGGVAVVPTDPPPAGGGGQRPLLPQFNLTQFADSSKGNAPVPAASPPGADVEVVSDLGLSGDDLFNAFRSGHVARDDDSS